MARSNSSKVFDEFMAAATREVSELMAADISIEMGVCGLDERGHPTKTCAQIIKSSGEYHIGSCLTLIA